MSSYTHKHVRISSILFINPFTLLYKMLPPVPSNFCLLVVFFSLREQENLLSCRLNTDHCLSNSRFLFEALFFIPRPFIDCCHVRHLYSKWPTIVFSARVNFASSPTFVKIFTVHTKLYPTKFSI